MVKIHSALGKNKTYLRTYSEKVLDPLPRVGEQIWFGDILYRVEWVRHLLDGHTRDIEIYVRRHE